MFLPLVQLQQAVLNDDRANIESYFAALDQISANKRLEAMGEHYGFTTFWEPDAFDGWRVMLGQDLAHVMYGTRDTSSLRQLMKRLGFDLIDSRGKVHDTLSLKAHFGLAKTVSHASFATWQHFLVASFNGATPLARKVGSYLLAMEREGRIQEEMQLQRPGTAIERLRQSLLDRANDLTEAVILHDDHLLIHDGRLNDHAGQLKAIVTDIREARLRHQQEHARRQISSIRQATRQRFPEYVKQAFLAIWQQQDCMYPGCTKTQIIVRRDYEYDHVVAPAHGGTNDIRNIGLLCKADNALKNERYIADYRPTWLVEALEKRYDKWMEDDTKRRARLEPCLWCGVPGCGMDCQRDMER
jgi:hypothetical protein